MKRYARLLATYVLIALAVVLLYAPWALALRPSDYSILRAGLSIICGIALAGTFVASTYLTLKDPDVKLLSPAQVMREDEVVPVLEGYADVPYVGSFSSNALDQVRSAQRKRKRLRKVIDAQFSAGSLSWDKFAGLVETAERTVLRNAAVVANGVQTFDTDAYVKARKHDASELALYDNELARMQEVLAANDSVLLEMGKLELELSKLNDEDVLEDNSQTVEDLQALIENTRYYR